MFRTSSKSGSFRSTQLLAGLAGLGLVASSAPAHAAVTTYQASLAIQTGMTDPDAYMLNQAFGLNTPLTYNSSSDDAGWTGNMHGSYNGKNVNMNYVGDMSQIDSGLVNWSVNGGYNGTSIHGSGAAQFVPNGNNFDILISTSLTIGNRTFTQGGMTEGILNGMGELDSGASNMGLDDSGGNTPFDTYGWFWEHTADGGYRNGYIIHTIWGPIYIVTSGCGHFSTGGGFDMNQTVTVPEPASLGLLGLGALGALRWRRAFG